MSKEHSRTLPSVQEHSRVGLFKSNQIQEHLGIRTNPGTLPLFNVDVSNVCYYLVVEYGGRDAEATERQRRQIRPHVLVGIVELDRVEKQLLVAPFLDDVFDSGDRVQPPLGRDQTEAYPRPVHRRQLSPRSVARIVSVERGTVQSKHLFHTLTMQYSTTYSQISNVGKGKVEV